MGQVVLLDEGRKPLLVDPLVGEQPRQQMPGEEVADHPVLEVGVEPLPRRHLHGGIPEDLLLREARAGRTPAPRLSPGRLLRSGLPASGLFPAGLPLSGFLSGRRLPRRLRPAGPFLPLPLLLSGLPALSGLLLPFLLLPCLLLPFLLLRGLLPRRPLLLPLRLQPLAHGLQGKLLLVLVVVLEGVLLRGEGDPHLLRLLRQRLVPIAGEVGGPEIDGLEAAPGGNPEDPLHPVPAVVVPDLLRREGRGIQLRAERSHGLHQVPGVVPLVLPLPGVVDLLPRGAQEGAVPLDQVAHPDALGDQLLEVLGRGPDSHLLGEPPVVHGTVEPSRLGVREGAADPVLDGLRRDLHAGLRRQVVEDDERPEVPRVRLVVRQARIRAPEDPDPELPGRRPPQRVPVEPAHDLPEGEPGPVLLVVAPFDLDPIPGEHEGAGGGGFAASPEHGAGTDAERAQHEHAEPHQADLLDLPELLHSSTAHGPSRKRGKPAMVTRGPRPDNDSGYRGGWSSPRRGRAARFFSPKTSRKRRVVP